MRPAKNLKQARDLAKFAPSNAEGGGVAVDAATLRAILPGVAVPDEVEDATLSSVDGANLTALGHLCEDNFLQDIYLTQYLSLNLLK